MRYIINVPANINSGDEKTSSTTCYSHAHSEAGIMFTVAILGMLSNILIICLIVMVRHLRKLTNGFIFHQCLVDGIKSSLCIPFALGIAYCSQPPGCSILGAFYIQLVTVSLLNILTMVSNEAQTVGYKGERDLHVSLFLNTPKCVIFGLSMIWFAGFTINLGPVFLSGASGYNQDIGNCGFVYGPIGHYALNIIWILFNVMCIALTSYQIYRLHRDFLSSNIAAVRVASMVTTMISVNSTKSEHRRIRQHLCQMENDSIHRITMYTIVVISNLLFWTPLYLLTLIDPHFNFSPTIYKVCTNFAFAHSVANPVIFLICHKGLRLAAWSAFLHTSNDTYSFEDENTPIANQQNYRSPMLPATNQNEASTPQPVVQCRCGIEHVEGMPERCLHFTETNV